MYIYQVATPFSSGTGVYLPEEELIVTNEHVVRDSASVVIGREDVDERLARVVYLDPVYDLAFLRFEESPDLRDLTLAVAAPPVGSSVVSIGHLFGERRRVTEGSIVQLDRIINGVPHLIHDARDGSTLAGSGVFGQEGELVGINMRDWPEGEGQSLCLPAEVLRGVLTEFGAGKGQPAARCFECRRVTFEVGLNPQGYCPNCGENHTLESMVRDAEPNGVNATIEEIIAAADHDPRLARRGPNLWKISKGSADIHIAYHEDSGLVTGDAYLCQLPEAAGAEVFQFLLRENARTRQLTFSTYGRDIILSLLIYDRYLSVETALPRFEYLFQQADDYDNILVEQYGAGW